MSTLYLVSAIRVADPESGELGGVRPDVPPDVDWVGNTDGIEYVVLTDALIPGAERLFDAEKPVYPLWQENEDVVVGDRRMYDSIAYVCIQAHRTQQGWTPTATPALWQPSREPGDPWVQPTMAENAYSIDDIVSYEQNLWRSLINANTTTPGSDERWWELGLPMFEVIEEVRSRGAEFNINDPIDVWGINRG